MHTISLNPIILRIDLHLRHHIIELHIPLPDFPAIFNRLNPLVQIVGGDCTGFDGGLRDEEDGGGGHEGREHGARDDRFDGGDGGVGIALMSSLVGL